MLLVLFVLLAVKIYAFVSSLTFSAESYEAAGKLTKPAWTIILGLGVVLQLLFGGGLSSSSAWPSPSRPSSTSPTSGPPSRGSPVADVFVVVTARDRDATSSTGSVSLQSETRPWGSWHVLDEGEGYKVKRIVVDPHSRLSYQYHHHRAEHWVVATGKATCVIDGVTRSPARGSASRSRSGSRTASATTRTSRSSIIEIQRGEYTGEDDIVRLEDDYGRSEA